MKKKYLFDLQEMTVEGFEGEEDIQSFCITVCPEDFFLEHGHMKDFYDDEDVDFLEECEKLGELTEWVFEYDDLNAPRQEIEDYLLSHGMDGSAEFSEFLRKAAEE